MTFLLNKNAGCWILEYVHNHVDVRLSFYENEEGKIEHGQRLLYKGQEYDLIENDLYESLEHAPQSWLSMSLASAYIGEDISVILSRLQERFAQIQSEYELDWEEE